MEPFTSVSASRIMEMVVEESGYSEERLRSEDRHKPLVQARHALMYLLRKHIGWSYPRIAQYCNRLDHTTIIHAVRKIERRSDPDILEIIGTIEFRLAALPSRKTGAL